MKLLYKILIILFISTSCYAGDIVVFDEGDDSIILYRKSVNTPDWEGRSDVLINPDVSALNDIPLKYWKHSSGTVVEMTTGEKTTVDNAITTANNASIRTSAEGDVDAFSVDGVRLRAALLVVMDEINILRATQSLADRTASQLKTAVKGKVSSGDAD